MKDRVVCRGRDLKWDGNDIVLRKIALENAPQNGLDIDRDWLKEEVLRPLSALTQKDIDALRRIAENG